MLYIKRVYSNVIFGRGFPKLFLVQSQEMVPYYSNLLTGLLIVAVQVFEELDHWLPVRISDCFQVAVDVLGPSSNCCNI